MLSEGVIPEVVRKVAGADKMDPFALRPYRQHIQVHLPAGGATVPRVDVEISDVHISDSAGGRHGGAGH